METRGMGEELLRVRRLRMWTQGRLAEEAGVSPTTVSGIESGRISIPHFGTVRKLARALGVEPRDLLSAGVREAPAGPKVPASLSLGWAGSVGEEELERALEQAPLDRLETLRGELDEERGRLQALYGGFPEGSEQRRYLKRQIRVVAAQSGSVATSILFRGNGNVGHAGADAGFRAEEGAEEGATGIRDGRGRRS